MERSLEQLLSTAKNRLSLEEYEQIIYLLQSHLSECADDNRIWAAIAHLQFKTGKPQLAIDNISEAINLCGIEPHYYYTRGQYYFTAANFTEAIFDFTKTIDYCDIYHSDYYRFGALFFRSDAYLRLGKLSEAQADCNNIPDDMCTWTDRLRHKEDLVREIKLGYEKRE